MQALPSNETNYSSYLAGESNMSKLESKSFEGELVLRSQAEASQGKSWQAEASWGKLR